MKLRMLVCLILPLFALSGCTAYKSQYTGFRPPEAYPGHQIVDGVSIGGEAYADKSDAKKAFGFDIKGAGLLPVQLVLDNKSRHEIIIIPDQSFLVDKEGRYWNLVPTSAAIDRLEKSTQLASFFGAGAGKGALLGVAAGTILGAAVGIVSGHNIGSAIGKGAALGAAGGAVVGGVKEGTSGERERRITDDIRDKSIEGKVIPPDSLSNGFLFFPGEADSARELRLQYQERDTAEVRTVVMPLK